MSLQRIYQRLEATVWERYANYLAAASLGFAAVLRAMPAEAEAWLAHAVAALHADPDFNRAWIEEIAWPS